MSNFFVNPCILSQAHGDPQLIQLTYISDRIFRELNGLIKNLLLPQYKDILSIVDREVSKSSDDEYIKHSFSLSLCGYTQGKPLKPDWDFLLDCIEPYRELSREEEPF